VAAGGTSALQTRSCRSRLAASPTWRRWSGGGPARSSARRSPLG